MHYSGTEAYMASAGIPMIGLLLPLSILIELGGGLLIVLGLFTRPVAMQQIHFMKNLAIMGGMLMLAAYGPGSWSLDTKRSR